MEEHVVEAAFNYLAPMQERPYYYAHEAPRGERWRNTHGDRRTLTVHDARDVPDASLDREGFELVRIESEFDPSDARSVRNVYFPEVERAVREAAGAERVVSFDFNLRAGDGKGLGGVSGTQQPVRFVHNDYTEASGPQRVRDVMGVEAEVLLPYRFAVVNVWKPLHGPVLEAPLAFCDARGIEPGDLVATDLRYVDRVGEIYSLTWNAKHRWYYYSKMQTDEALLLKCYDSDPDRARFTAHSAFDLPDTPTGAPARESIEVRTLVFWRS
jgi:hypothetical protein